MAIGWLMMRRPPLQRLWQVEGRDLWEMAGCGWQRSLVGHL